MAFNNDVGVTKLFVRFMTDHGKEDRWFFCSGSHVFHRACDRDSNIFYHLVRNAFTVDPTPMEVQMRLMKMSPDNFSRKCHTTKERTGGRKMNLLQIIFLALLGLSAGMVVAGGVFSFIVELGVISDFADRTHTGNHILIYEDMVAAGAILGNLFQIFEVNLPGRMIFLAIYGLFGGIFVGCWAWHLQKY